MLHTPHTPYKPHSETHGNHIPTNPVVFQYESTRPHYHCYQYPNDRNFLHRRRIEFHRVLWQMYSFVRRISARGDVGCSEGVCSGGVVGAGCSGGVVGAGCSSGGV